MDKNKTLLIIEDDEVLLRAMYLFLRKTNYIIATATDGESGLKIAERLKPDLVLLDMVLPKMNGLDVLRNLKAGKNTKNIPVIIVSNLDSMAEIKMAKDLGAVEYFIKANSKIGEIYKYIEKILVK